MPIIVFTRNTTVQNGSFDTQVDNGEDLSIREESPDFSRDGEADLSFGNSSSENNNNLFRFDAITANLASNDIVNSATLYIYQKADGFGSFDINSHGLIRQWTRTEATWNSASTGVSWTTGGAIGSGTDRQSAIDGTATIGTASTYVSIDVTAIVTDIKNGVLTTDSIMVESVPVSGDGGFRFCGRYNGTDGERAELFVDFTVPSSGLAITQDNQTVAIAGSPFRQVTFSGDIPPEVDDLGFELVSFYGLAVRDLAFTPAAGDILHFEPAPGLSVDIDTIPTVNAPGVTMAQGRYFWEDVSLSTNTAKANFLIDSRIQIEGNIANETQVVSFMEGALTGTISIAQGDNVLDFQGQPLITATLAFTQDDEITNFQGQPLLSGTLDLTQTNDIVAFESGNIVTGTISFTQDHQLADFQGSPLIDGDFTISQDNNVLDFQGEPLIDGTTAIIQDNDVVDFQGSPLVDGTMDIVQGNNITDFQGEPLIDGTIDIDQNDNIVDFQGEPLLTITFSITQDNDVLNFQAGSTLITGTIAFNQDNNIADFQGQSLIDGTITFTQDNNIVAFQSSQVGTIGISQEDDIINFQGAPLIMATVTIAQENNVVGFQAANTASKTITQDNNITNFQGAPLISGVIGIIQEEQVFNAVPGTLSGILGISQSNQQLNFSEAEISGGTQIFGPVTRNVMRATMRPVIGGSEFSGGFIPIIPPAPGQGSFSDAFSSDFDI